MVAPSTDLTARIASIVARHATPDDRHILHEELLGLAQSSMPDALVAAAEPWRNEPDVIAPIYEAVVSAQPSNARALVILANSYWLQGRGPQVVGELATRAMSADPANRGAWHLWALSEPDPRSRVQRWQQVAERFPEDHLALAAVADNAASVAGAERDYEMLDLAIEAYELLLTRSTETSQRDAVSAALGVLKGWKF